MRVLNFGLLFCCRQWPDYQQARTCGSCFMHRMSRCHWHCSEYIRIFAIKSRHAFKEGPKSGCRDFRNCGGDRESRPDRDFRPGIAVLGSRRKRRRSRKNTEVALNAPSEPRDSRQTRVHMPHSHSGIRLLHWTCTRAFLLSSLAWC